MIGQSTSAIKGDRPRLVLAGGSGLLGTLLASHFSGQGWEVVVLTRKLRNPGNGIREMLWDGETLGGWKAALEGSQGLINLCGASVNCRYTARNRKRLVDSRIYPTQVLGKAIAACEDPPKVWLNASTATIYRHTFGLPWDESGEVGSTPEAKDEFSIVVATAWERAFDEMPTPRTRKLLLRTAMVLSMGRNSVFPVLRRLVRLGLGGSMAGGSQYVSWIHEDDFCRAVQWLLENPELSGVFNLAAPHPVTNEEMMRILRRICHRSIGLPASSWMLEIGAFFLRTETELIIKSRRVAPGALTASGFRFRFPELESALEDLNGKDEIS